MSNTTAQQTINISAGTHGWEIEIFAAERKMTLTRGSESVSVWYTARGSVSSAARGVNASDRLTARDSGKLETILAWLTRPVAPLEVTAAESETAMTTQVAKAAQDLATLPPVDAELVNACGCESSECHHEYLSVPAGTRSAVFVGPVCDACADTHMATYVPAEPFVIQDTDTTPDASLLEVIDPVVVRSEGGRFTVRLFLSEVTAVRTELSRMVQGLAKASGLLVERPRKGAEPMVLAPHSAARMLAALDRELARI